MTLFSQHTISLKPQVTLNSVIIVSTIQMVLAFQMVLTAFEGPVYGDLNFLMSKLFFFVGLALDCCLRFALVGVERDDEGRRDFAVTLISCSFYVKCLTIAIVFLSLTILDIFS